MKILVVGGTLFIGRALVRALLKEGHEVSVLHRRAQHPFGRRVGNLVADRNDPAAVRAAIAGQDFDAVFDNAYDWERGTTAEQVVGTVQAFGDRLRRYIFMSSVAAYGDGLSRREDDALAPDDHPDAYVRNKAMAERALFRLYHRHRVPVVTLRPPFVYGPENPFYREAFFWDRMRSRRPIIVPGDGNRLMQFVYVKDLVAACLAALERPVAGQAFNVGDPRPVSQRELVDALALAAAKKPALALVPRRTIQRAGGHVMRDPLYFGMYFDMPPITMATQKAPRLLGIRYTPFEKGLKETYRWYLRNHKRPKQDWTLEDRLLTVGTPAA